MADENNPFQDAAVNNATSATQAPPSYGQEQAYGGDAAYGQAASFAQDAYSSAPPQVKQQAATMAVNVAQDQAQQQIANAYEEAQGDVAAQSDQHQAPGAPDWCSRCMNWFPVRYFAVFGGVLLIVFPILDFAFNLGTNPSLVDVLVYFYLIIAGFVIIFVELPSFSLTRKPQLVIFFWSRILSRMWGRAWFYLIIATLCLSYFESNNTRATGFAGVYWLCIMIAMFVISRKSATKYQRMFVFVAAGKEGPERIANFQNKFTELDIDGDDFIDASAIRKLATQAGRELANAERHGIQTFLDQSCNGPVSREDFVKTFETYNLKQRWL